MFTSLVDSCKSQQFWAGHTVPIVSEETGHCKSTRCSSLLQQ